MPLKTGKSNKTVSANIKTLVDDYKRSGKIGTSKPASKAAAIKQATAIALSKAGRAKKYAEGGEVEDEKLTPTEKEKQEAARTQQLAPSTNIPRSTDSGAPGQVRRTRPNVRFHVENIDVTKPPVRAMKHGGKVVSKKGRK